jgi:cytochrome c peroxidase
VATRRSLSLAIPPAMTLALASALLLPTAARSADVLRQQAAARFGQVAAPSPAELAAPAVALGRALFWDARLSADGRTACASCHPAAGFSADPRRRSPDARGRLTARQAQPVLNSQAAAAGLRWTGDRASGAAQAEGSITGSLGFATPADLVARLRATGYAPRFAATFPTDTEPLTAANYGLALQAYQATLRTPAAFDAWLAGDDQALDAAARRGLERFMATGCDGCHSGPLFGGGSLQRFGVVADYRAFTGSTGNDQGRMATTGRPEDRDRFRVQPLRNVARTGPYFHDGSVADLRTAVAIMARVQLGQTPPEEALDDITAFLGALTGAVPAHYAPPPD